MPFPFEGHGALSPADGPTYEPSIITNVDPRAAPVNELSSATNLGGQGITRQRYSTKPKPTLKRPVSRDCSGYHLYDEQGQSRGSTSSSDRLSGNVIVSSPRKASLAISTMSRDRIRPCSTCSTAAQLTNCDHSALRRRSRLQHSTARRRFDRDCGTGGGAGRRDERHADTPETACSEARVRDDLKHLWTLVRRALYLRHRPGPTGHRLYRVSVIWGLPPCLTDSNVDYRSSHVRQQVSP